LTDRKVRPTLHLKSGLYIESGDGTGENAKIITRTPTSPTNSTDADLTLGGTDIVTYKYKLDSGSYSSETAVATQISLSSLEEGSHTVSVIGKDSNGNWQTEADATTLTRTVDLTAPNAPVVIDIGDSDEDQPTLDWENATGASYYIVEYDDNPDFSSPTSNSNILHSDYTVTSALADGTWYWRVKAVDATGNTSGWSSTDNFTVDTILYCAFDPEKPVLDYPVDGAINISQTPTLTASSYVEPLNCSTHWKTRWQISEYSDFHALVLNANTFDNLTTFEVIKTLLKPNTTYYWRGKYWGSNGNKSLWSDVSSFTTELAVDDADNNGIPDGHEVEYSLDLDGDGTADNDQTDQIKSIKATKGDANIGIRPQDSEITKIEVLNSDTILDDGNKPRDIPYGLMAFRLEVPNYGDTTTIKIYLSKPVHKNAIWMKYDPVYGWLDYSDYAAFNDARDEVTLELKDGGYGDNDHTENGVIIDPCGPAIVDSSLTGSSSSGCFIANAAYGSLMEPHVKILCDFRDRFMLGNR
jgi:hypothetical protein